MARVIKVTVMLDSPEFSNPPVHGSLPMSLLVDILNFPQPRDWPLWKKAYVILMNHTTGIDAF